jgi:chromosome segregation ATPase
MAGVGKLAEKVPGWVERLLIPTLESRVRQIVREEVGHLEKQMDSRFEGMNSEFEAKFEGVDVRFEAVNSKIDSLERAMNDRFEVVTARFDSLERRLPLT